jgi:hypothetical protein
MGSPTIQFQPHPIQFPPGIDHSLEGSCHLCHTKSW